MSSRRGLCKRERERGVELAGNATVADAFELLYRRRRHRFVVLFSVVTRQILGKRGTRLFRVLGGSCRTRREKEERL